jgi:ADP-ribose pyrophosphatase YjhB (NUDIX family)
MGSIGHVVAATCNRNHNETRIPMKQVVEKFNTLFDVIPCSRCQRCDCSEGIEIESLFRYHNYYHLGHRNWAYNRLKGKAELLERCIVCVQKKCQGCFNGVDIQTEIIKILQSIKRGRLGVTEQKLKAGKDYIGVGVGAVIFRDDKILLLLRSKAPESGCWTIPGGKLEFGETVEEAILREVQEEIGIEGRIIAPLGVTNHILKDEGTHYVSPRFLVSVIGEPINAKPDSHSEIAWFSIDSLPENVTMTTQKAIAAFLTWNQDKRA